MHTRTDSRWDQVRELRPFILETLPIKPLDRTIDNSRDLYMHGEVFDEAGGDAVSTASNWLRPSVARVDWNGRSGSMGFVVGLGPDKVTLRSIHQSPLFAFNI